MSDPLEEALTEVEPAPLTPFIAAIEQSIDELVDDDFEQEQELLEQVESFNSRPPSSLDRPRTAYRPDTSVDQSISQSKLFSPDDETETDFYARVIRTAQGPRPAEVMTFDDSNSQSLNQTFNDLTFDSTRPMSTSSSRSLSSSGSRRSLSSASKTRQSSSQSSTHPVIQSNSRPSSSSVKSPHHRESSRSPVHHTSGQSINQSESKSSRASSSESITRFPPIHRTVAS